MLDKSFILERSGVTYDQRFYIGHNTMSSRPMWGPPSEAVKFHSESRANSMSYRVDDEEGCYTYVVQSLDYDGAEAADYSGLPIDSSDHE